MYGNCGIKAEEGLARSRYPCVWQTYFPKFIDPVTAAGPALLMKIGIYMTAEKQRQPANGSPYRGLILFRAGIRDRKESQQSAVIDRKNVAIVLRKVDKLNGMFVTLTNLDDATGNMIKQQQRMLLEFAGFGLLLIVVVNLIVRGLLKEFL